MEGREGREAGNKGRDDAGTQWDNRARGGGEAEAGQNEIKSSASEQTTSPRQERSAGPEGKWVTLNPACSCTSLSLTAIFVYFDFSRENTCC